jgi:hypothetical protein
LIAASFASLKARIQQIVWGWATAPRMAERRQEEAAQQHGRVS